VNGFVADMRTSVETSPDAGSIQATGATTWKMTYASLSPDQYMVVAYVATGSDQIQITVSGSFGGHPSAPSGSDRPTRNPEDGPMTIKIPIRKGQDFLWRFGIKHDLETPDYTLRLSIGTKGAAPSFEKYRTDKDPDGHNDIYASGNRVRILLKKEEIATLNQEDQALMTVEDTASVNARLKYTIPIQFVG
jgi:hypothetical protein